MWEGVTIVECCGEEKNRSLCGGSSVVIILSYTISELLTVYPESSARLVRIKFDIADKDFITSVVWSGQLARFCRSLGQFSKSNFIFGQTLLATHI